MEFIRKHINRLVPALEVLIVALVLFTAFLPKKNIQYTASDFNMVSGIYNENGDAYVDYTINTVGVFLTTPSLDLGYGTYEITIDYEADQDGNLVYLTLPRIMSNEEDVNDRFVANTVVLSASETKATVETLIYSRHKDYMAAVFFMGNGGIQVRSITIAQTNGGIFRLAATLTFIFILIDLILLFVRKRKAGKISDETVSVGFLLAGIAGAASIPLLLNYMIEGHDLTFHLLRIEGIKEAVEMGEFPVRIQPNWLSGNGYAASIFYGDLFLYIPAFLRICGFHITEAYNIYVFLTNLATCLVSYGCFKGMFKKRNLAVIGSMLYTLSLYRIINIYIRSAVGEYTAMIFLPVIAYGMWSIFTEDIHTKEYKKKWIIPVIGFTGIINTHILTCEMTGAFILLLCLIMIKKVFRKETFLVLVKIVLFTIVLNANFLVPFFDYMIEGGFVVTSGERFSSGIQQFGAFIGQLLVPFANDSGLAVNVVEGMAGEFPSTAGLSLIFGGLTLIYVFAMGYIKERKTKICGGIALGFGIFALWLSSHLFPWDYFQNMNKLFNKLVSMISMPWRFLTIAAVVLTIATIIALEALNEAKKAAYTWIVAALTVLCFLQSSTLMSNIMNGAEPLAVYTAAALDDSNLIGCEYLPALASQEAYASNYILNTENIQVEEIYRKYNKSIFTVENQSSENGFVNLSMVYYKGYTAVDENGQRLEIYPANGFTTGVVIEPGYQGTVTVKFAGFWYWKLAFAVSVGFLIFMFLYGSGKLEKIYKFKGRNVAETRK